MKIHKTTKKQALEQLRSALPTIAEQEAFLAKLEDLCHKYTDILPINKKTHQNRSKTQINTNLKEHDTKKN